LIADDRVVICGSANLNDRSQLGSHDSEIAVVVEDPTVVESKMDGVTYSASLFATTLRRQLFRKHLGLLPPQDMRVPTSNFHGIEIPNQYDFNSPDDKAVADPLSDAFETLWRERAKSNTDIFARVFQPLPHDSVKTWDQYDAYYTKLFTVPKDAPAGTQPKYQYGHVVLENFEKPETEVKEALSKVRGALVEMPLLFLSQEDIAKTGLSLNRFTDEIYT
jgi:phospholipase D1/2